MHALAGNGVQVGREGGGERLALAGLHLGDAALMQRDRADELHVERALAQRAHRALAHGGVGLGQQGVERLAVFVARAELRDQAAQLRVGHGLVFRLEIVDLLHDAAEARHFLFVAAAQQVLYEIKHG